jgi:hypothetical protein
MAIPKAIPADSGADLDRGIGRARRALSALHPAEIAVASESAVAHHASPLVSAWVLWIAAGRPGPAWRRVAASHRRSLLDRPSAERGRFADGGPASPALDADAALAACSGLLDAGAPESDAGAGAALDQARRTGVLPPAGAPAGEIPSAVDVVVATEALRLAERLGRTAPGLGAAVAAFVDRNGLNAGFGSTVFRSPFAFAWRLRRWLSARRPEAGPPAELERRVFWECHWRRAEALANPLDCAFALATLVDLGPGSGAPDWRHGLDELATAVLEAQDECGLWPGAPLAQLPGGETVGSFQLTSAVCLDALERRRAARARPAPGGGRSWLGAQLANPLRRGPGLDPRRPLAAGTLEPILAAVANEIPASLVSDAALRDLRHVARRLPGGLTHGFGLECRLAGGARADLRLCITSTAAGRDLLAGPPASPPLPGPLAAAEPWRRVGALCRRWRDPASPLHDAVGDVWLEFDLDGAPPPVPVPSVFCCLRDRPDLRVPADPAAAAARVEGYQAVFGEALAELTAGRCPAAVEERLGDCIAAIPPGAYPFALGAMVARDTRAVRLCVKGLAIDRVADYLEAAGWPGSHRRLAELLGPLPALAGRVVVDLDVGAEVLPGVGIECSFDHHRPPALEPRWQALLDHLVAAGACQPDKRDALLAWPGKAHRLEGGLERFIDKLLGHVKLSLRSDGSLEAKAYFGAWVVIERRLATAPAAAHDRRRDVETEGRA